MAVFAETLGVILESEGMEVRLFGSVTREGAKKQKEGNVCSGFLAVFSEAFDQLAPFLNPVVWKRTISRPNL